MPWNDPVIVPGSVFLAASWMSSVASPSEVPGPQVEGDRHRGQLAGVRDALRPGIHLQRRYRVQRHQVAGIRFQVDHVQPVGVRLELRQHLQQHAVLIVRRVDGGGELRSEGVVERLEMLIQFSPRAAARSRSRMMLTRGVLDLQVARNIHAGPACAPAPAPVSAPRRKAARCPARTA